MSLAIRNGNKTREQAVAIETDMNLFGVFCAAEFGPGEGAKAKAKAKAKVNGGRVQEIAFAAEAEALARRSPVTPGQQLIEQHFVKPTGLSFIFALQHSGIARSAFRLLTRYILQTTERSPYVLLSTVWMALLM